MSLCVCVSLWAHLHRSKYGQGTLEGNRFKTHHNGTLEIKRIRIEDQGTYLCVVSNIAGRDESQVQIEVKGKGHLITPVYTILFQCGIHSAVSFALLRAHCNCHETHEHESHPRN